MSEPSAEPFGDQVRRLRVLAGMSQEDLAERSGLSVRGISDLERGLRRAPRLATVRMLADALKLDERSRRELIAASRASARAASIPPVSSTTELEPLSPARTTLLPRESNRLIGRASEQREILALFHDQTTRLITLAGPGGTGKTRLAMHLANVLKPTFDGGVFVVRLSQLSDPDLVVPTIASVVGVNESADGSFHDGLVSRLARHSVLLLLDNFEHVVSASHDVSLLLQALPDLIILVTSRVPLRIQMERVYRVPPLAVPDPQATTAPEDIERFPALALFVERARMADASLQVRPATMREVQAICERLDGLPLAIELAAARTRVLTISELLALLERDSLVLTNGARDLPRRHQSLRDTIEWSYALLSVDEQQLFRTVSVFSGGWTLESAERVATGMYTGIARHAVLDSLTTLVDHSLVRRVSGSEGVSRFVMLNTIREYALDRLSAQGEYERARDHHARIVAAQLLSGDGTHATADETTAFDAIQVDYNNVRSALGWLIERGAASDVLPMCIALWRFWMVRGYLSEGRRWMDAALALDASHSTESRALCLYGASILACHQNDLATATRMTRESLAISRDIGDVSATLTALHGQGLVAQLLRDYDAARSRYEESLALSRPLGHSMLPLTLSNMAQVCFHVGDNEQAITLLSEGVAIFRGMGADSMLAVALTDLALIMLESGQDQSALELFIESVQAHRAVGAAAPSIAALEGIAAVSVNGGTPAFAATLYGAIEHLRDTYASPRQSPDRWNYEHYLTRAREAISDRDFLVAWESGRRMSIAEAQDFALTASAPQ